MNKLIPIKSTKFIRKMAFVEKNDQLTPEENFGGFDETFL